jgi:hypothetical protein
MSTSLSTEQVIVAHQRQRGMTVRTPSVTVPSGLIVITGACGSSSQRIAKQLSSR